MGYENSTAFHRKVRGKYYEIKKSTNFLPPRKWWTRGTLFEHITYLGCIFFCEELHSC
jgi:hypothetical protein